MRGHAFTGFGTILYLAFCSHAGAHHSAAAFNTAETVEVAGTITEYNFRNPHVYMTLSVTNPDGTDRQVEVEAGAGSVIAPLGFTRDAVAVGDRVTVIGNPGRRNPQGLVLGRELYKADGSYYPLNISSRSAGDFGNDVADSIAGTWFPPRTAFFGYLGEANDWPLTAAGKEAIAGFNPQSTTHKDCIPIGIPGLMVYPVADTIEVQADRVTMDIDWLDSARTIWLDGRPHPDASEGSLFGHSTGHWEGQALVVETTNFTDHPMGLTMSLPGSRERTIHERFELSNDGRQMLYSGEITDPVYLTAPVTWSSAWVYRPGMAHANEKCDIEVARKFLDD